jgi:hypothetical protein
MLLYITVFSQTYQIVDKQYNISDSIIGFVIEGAFKVNYTQNDHQSLTVVSLPEDASKIEVETIATESKDKKYLKLSGANISKPSALIVNIQSKKLEFIEISGISSFVNNGDFNQDVLNIISSGTSKIIIKGDIKDVTVISSGTSSVYIEGNSDLATIESSGVSMVDISNLNYTESFVTTSGISNVYLNAQEDNNNIVSSGMSSVNFLDSKTIHPYSDKKTDTITRVGSNATVTIYDTDAISLNETMDMVWEITEATIDRISGNNKKYKLKWRRNKFDGHWGGIDIGINGYNTADFKGNFPEEYSYLDLHYPKSISFYLNLLEFNIPFSKNQKWGMLTGLGLEWHNYRFSHQTWLSNDGPVLSGYYVEGVGLKKSKLTTCYLTVPLIFEFQTNNEKSFRNSFHVGAGVIGGVRIGTHSKIKFESRNNTFILINPEAGQESQELAMHCLNRKYKNYSDFFLTPLKLDATVRVGWGRINLFATYSIFEMFRANKGTELYPWSIGITLWGW